MQSLQDPGSQKEQTLKISDSQGEVGVRTLEYHEYLR